MQLASLQNFELSTWVLFGILCLGAFGCGRDSGQGATIIVKGTPIVVPAPSASPYVLRGGNRIDTDSQGGNDDGLVHQTSAGVTVSNISVGGNYQRTEATSANFKVTGGIYVQ